MKRYQVKRNAPRVVRRLGKRWRIVCLGDSLTEGYGVAPEENWIALLNQRGAHTFINRGVNGDTTAGMLARFGDDVVTERPDVVVLMGGINDFSNGAFPEQVEQNLKELIELTWAIGARPVVGIPMKPNLKTVRRDWSEETDFEYVIVSLETLRQWILAQPIETADLYRAFQERTEGAYGAYFVDGLHPNAKGQVLEAEVFAEVFGLS